MQDLQHTKLLFHSLESIGRSVELKDLLLRSMNAIRAVMSAEASSLMLLDEVTGELNVSIPTGPVQNEIKGFSIPKDKGIGGWVIQNNTSYITNDIKSDPFFWKDLSNDFSTRNIVCVPLRNRDGNAFGVLQALNRIGGASFHEDSVEIFHVLAEHISMAIQRTREYEAMEAALQDKQLLIEETNHRLKNNLFAISALLELESANVIDQVAIEALKSASLRIKSVADLHAILYQEKADSTIDVKEFFDKIIANVESIYSSKGSDVQIGIKIDDDIELKPDLSILLGLTVNELLINAFKYAFAGNDNGKIEISVENIANEKIIVRFSDNGVGIVSDSGFKEKNHLYIVNAFIRRMNATLEKPESELGTNYLIEVPL